MQQPHGVGVTMDHHTPRATHLCGANRQQLRLDRRAIARGARQRIEKQLQPVKHGPLQQRALHQLHGCGEHALPSSTSHTGLLLHGGGGQCERVGREQQVALIHQCRRLAHGRLQCRAWGH